MSVLDYIWDAIFLLEMIIKLVAFGIKIYLRDKWNILDGAIVIVSQIGYFLMIISSSNDQMFKII